MPIVKRINDTGCKALKQWIQAIAKPDHCVTDQRAIEAWCQEAEESMGNGNPSMVEMSHLHSVSGVVETFTIPADGVYSEDEEDSDDDVNDDDDGNAPGYRDVSFTIDVRRFGAPTKHRLCVQVGAQDGETMARHLIEVHRLAWSDRGPIDIKPGAQRPRWID